MARGLFFVYNVSGIMSRSMCSPFIFHKAREFSHGLEAGFFGMTRGRCAVRFKGDRQLFRFRGKIGLFSALRVG